MLNDRRYPLAKAYGISAQEFTGVFVCVGV
jgi:hypothetical protein